MKDNLFIDFEKWIFDMEKVWESIGLKIANRNYTETHRHSYTVTLVKGGNINSTLHSPHSKLFTENLLTFSPFYRIISMSIFSFI